LELENMNFNSLFPFFLKDSLCWLPFTLKIGPWGRDNDCFEALRKAKIAVGESYLGDGDNSSFLAKYDIARKLGIFCVLV